MLKAHKPVVYFLEFSALDLLELTEEPEVVANSHMSLERRWKNSPWPLNRKLYKWTLKKNDDNNGNVFQSGGILETNNHFKSYWEGQLPATEFT